MIKHWMSMGVAVALLGCSTDEDPYLWLEDVGGDDALAWVGERNQATRMRLPKIPSSNHSNNGCWGSSTPTTVFPYVYKAGDWYYNLWQDEANPRGLWRRTTLDEYRKPDPAWEVVLDIDALGREEGENWVYGGAPILVPTYDRLPVAAVAGWCRCRGRARVSTFSPRRSSKTVSRSPSPREASPGAGPDEIFVATDFGPGTMTDSGYARIVKLWRRGQALEDATTVFEGEMSDVSVSAYAELSPGFEMQFVYRGRDFYNSDRFIRRDDDWYPSASLPMRASPSIAAGFT